MVNISAAGTIHGLEKWKTTKIARPSVRHPQDAKDGQDINLENGKDGGGLTTADTSCVEEDATFDSGVLECWFCVWLIFKIILFKQILYWLILAIYSSFILNALPLILNLNLVLFED